MDNIKNAFNYLTIGSIIVDVLIIILGIFFMTNPTVGPASTLMLIGILLLVSGVASIIKYIINPNKIIKFELAYGLLSIILGALAIFKPFTIEMLIVVLVGIWLIVSSILKLVIALELRKIKENTWIFDLTVSILVIIIGIMIIVNPFKSSMVLSVYIGVMMTIYAAMDIVEQFFIRKRAKSIMQVLTK